MRPHDLRRRLAVLVCDVDDRGVLERFAVAQRAVGLDLPPDHSISFSTRELGRVKSDSDFWDSSNDSRRST